MRLHTVEFGLAEGRRPDGQPMCGVSPKASLLCGTQVTRVRIDGGVGYKSCRTTWHNCFGPHFLFVEGPTASLCADLAEGQLACTVPKPGRMGSES